MVRYTMVLTTEPGDRVNAIDVSSAPEGVLLIRTSYPKDRKQVEVRPTVQVAARAARIGGGGHQG